MNIRQHRHIDGWLMMNRNFKAVPIHGRGACKPPHRAIHAQRRESNRDSVQSKRPPSSWGQINRQSNDRISRQKVEDAVERSNERGEWLLEDEARSRRSRADREVRNEVRKEERFAEISDWGSVKPEGHQAPKKSFVNGVPKQADFQRPYQRFASLSVLIKQPFNIVIYFSL